MGWSADASKVFWVLCGVFALSGCGGGDGGDGGDDDGGGPGRADGTVTEQWSAFCTGTFTKDTPIIDAFDEPLFTAKVGAEFLMADFSDTFGGRVEFLYLTNVGPDSFEVEPDANGDWPFTSNCAIGQGAPYYAAFTDVNVFSEKGLTTKSCSLRAGSVLPAGTTGRGYSFSGSLGESAIYEVILGPFSEQCQGLTRGYISVPHTHSFNSDTWLVPIASIIGPK
jgi:hypothetical protein